MSFLNVSVFFNFHCTRITSFITYPLIGFNFSSIRRVCGKMKAYFLHRDFSYVIWTIFFFNWRKKWQVGTALN